MTRLAIAASTGWAAVVALAWYLADRRIALCPAYPFATEVQHAACVLRTTAVRDNVLVWGAAIALVAVVAALAIYRRPQSWESRPAPRAQGQSRISG